MCITPYVDPGLDLNVCVEEGCPCECTDQAVLVDFKYGSHGSTSSNLSSLPSDFRFAQPPNNNAHITFIAK
jgi:hypothetical protein